MTFYEAALRVLEAEGRPLHFSQITEKSIQLNLLSHVGKTPEQTMLSRLAAMARRTRDRKVIVTAKDTFALADWLLPEDPEALAQTGVPETNPEEQLPPLRPVERHPEMRSDNAKGAGRGEREHRRRHREEEEGGRRRRRYPPIPEVAFEILAEAREGLRADQLAQVAKDKELGSDELGSTQILMALVEDNQRRIDAGRRPQFLLDPESGLLRLERAGPPSDAPPEQLQAPFAAALGLPMENGRPLLPRSAAPAEKDLGQDGAAALAVKAAAKEARKGTARTLRRRLAELDAGTFEKAVVKMLHGVGFRELKVAKRSKEGPLLTARRRDGSVELRYAVRILKGAPAVDRRMVQELRRDLGHYSAQVGLLACAGELRGDGKTEAQSSGSLVLLYCGDGLGEKFIEASCGVTTTAVELHELDERFFDIARGDAAESARRREERHQQREQQHDERPAPADGAAETAAIPEAAPPAEEAIGDDQEQGDEGDEGDEGEGDDDREGAPEGQRAGRPQDGAPAPGQPGAGDRKRRRRRRRGRRGRGPKPEGAGGAPGASAPAPAGAEPAGASPPPAPPPPNGNPGQA